jgi:hypothetical protein
VLDIELLALEGIYDVTNVPADRQGAFDALKGGDGVDQNDAHFSDSFPYIAAPSTEAVNQADGSSSGSAMAPAGGVGTGTGGTAAPATSSVQPGEGVLIPALTASAAALLIGAGGVSLLRSRMVTRKTATSPAV